MRVVGVDWLIDKIVETRFDRHFSIILESKLLGADLQGDQLNMAVCFCYLVKKTWSVFTCTVGYTEQVTFLQGTKKHYHV